MMELDSMAIIGPWYALPTSLAFYRRCRRITGIDISEKRRLSSGHARPILPRRTRRRLIRLSMTEHWN